MSGGSLGKRQLGLGHPPQVFSTSGLAVLFSSVVKRDEPLPTAFAHAAIVSEARRIFGFDIVTAIVWSAAGLVAFLLLHAAMRMVVDRLADAAPPPAQTSNQPSTVPAQRMERFVQQASLLHISERVAAEACKSLYGRLPGQASFSPNDDLRHLGLADDQIVAILYCLPQTCCRLPHAFRVTDIVTIYDLLAHVEAAPPLRSAKSLQRVAAKTLDPTVSPLAGLQNASPRDSRFRTRPHFSGMKRRATDYSGPYRRATDKAGDGAYNGPLRRASDRRLAANPPDAPAPREQVWAQHETPDRRQLTSNYSHRRTEPQNNPVISDAPAVPTPNRLPAAKSLAADAHLQTL